MMPPDSVLADFMSGLDPQISVMLYGLAPVSLNEAIMKAKMIEMGQRNAAGTMQFNAKVAQLEQENALLHQQLEWQPRPQPQQQMPQPQPHQQQTQRLPQNQVIKLQWKLFRKLRPKGRGLIHCGTESSWIINHLTVTKMTKETLGAMVVDKKGI